MGVYIEETRASIRFEIQIPEGRLEREKLSLAHCRLRTEEQTAGFRCTLVPPRAGEGRGARGGRDAGGEVA